MYFVSFETAEGEKTDELSRIELAPNIKSLVQLEEEIKRKTKKRKWKENYKLIYNFQIETIEIDSDESFSKLLNTQKTQNISEIELTLKFKVLFFCLFVCVSFFFVCFVLANGWCC